MNIDKTTISQAIKRGKKRGRPEGTYAPAPGIAQDRDRPKSVGHCGAENCSHASHAGHT